jgi:hypothetical protein
MYIDTHCQLLWSTQLDVAEAAGCGRPPPTLYALGMLLLPCKLQAHHLLQLTLIANGKARVAVTAPPNPVVGTADTPISACSTPVDKGVDKACPE